LHEFLIYLIRLLYRRKLFVNCLDLRYNTYNAARVARLGRTVLTFGSRVLLQNVVLAGSAFLHLYWFVLLLVNARRLVYLCTNLRSALRSRVIREREQHRKRTTVNPRRDLISDYTLTTETVPRACMGVLPPNDEISFKETAPKPAQNQSKVA
jgi:hypothetical protein